MARIPLLVPALAAGVILAASALASDTSHEFAAPSAPGAAGDMPAMGDTMLPPAVCAQREQVVAELERTFSETPMAVGQVDDSAVMEIFASDSGSWTILATGTNGVSCIISAGEGFESTTLVRGLDA